MPNFVTVPQLQIGGLSLSNRRRDVRHLRNRLCYVKPNGKNAGVSWGVQLLDISLHGLALVLPCELQTGTVIAVQPCRQNLTQALFARVIWQSEWDRGWLHGCEFIRAIEESELNRWLDGE